MFTIENEHTIRKEHNFNTFFSINCHSNHYCNCYMTVINICYHTAPRVHELCKKKQT